MKVYLIILIILINTSFDVTAATSPSITYKVDVKCYVELVDDIEMIYFARVKNSQINTLVDTLVGKKIPVPFARNKHQVQQAFECVLLESKFNSRKANDLFEKQPR